MIRRLDHRARFGIVAVTLRVTSPGSSRGARWLQCCGFTHGHIGLLLVAALLAARPAYADDAEAPFAVTFRESRSDPANLVAPLDPTPHIHYQYVGAMAFGLTLNQGAAAPGAGGLQRVLIGGANLCCGAGAIRTTFKIDDRVWHPNVPGMGQPLPPDKTGRARMGLQAVFIPDGVHITQVLEIVPSKAAPGQKRQLDTVLIRYVIENKSGRPRKVGTRVRIDTMCGNNDGALFAAPTRPGELLDGTELAGKTLPEYVQILERPNLKDPGLVGHFSLKQSGGRIGPDRFLCTAHGGVADNGWDAGLFQANGDSDAILYWSQRELKVGEKIEMAYAYGRGIAVLPESEGRIRVTLGGSFEPGKLFTVQAIVEEPISGQTLSLELPSGMTLVEGPPLQPVVTSAAHLATGMVLWKGRVERVGEFPMRIRSSNGLSETRTVTVTKTPS